MSMSHCPYPRGPSLLTEPISMVLVGYNIHSSTDGARDEISFLYGWCIRTQLFLLKRPHRLIFVWWRIPRVERRWRGHFPLPTSGAGCGDGPGVARYLGSYIFLIICYLYLPSNTVMWHDVATSIFVVSLQQLHDVASYMFLRADKGCIVCICWAFCF
jgi:hypothetical protein